METTSGLAAPEQADGTTGTLAVQVIVLAPAESLVLLETLDAVLAAPVARRVLAVSGPAGPGIPAGFHLAAPRGASPGERMASVLADAHAAVPLPMLLVRADTLAVTPDMISEAARALTSGEADAAFGPTADGGFWLLGLGRPDRSLVIGIPEDGGLDGTGPDGRGQGAGRLLLDRLASAGLRVARAPRLAVAG
jgi:hypothetical protein